MKACTGPFCLRSIVRLTAGFAVASALSLSRAADPAPAPAPPEPRPESTTESASTPASAPASAPATNSVVGLATNQVTLVDTTQPTRQMLESLQREIEMQVARHTEAITSSLMQIEPALDRIRQQQAEAAADSNRTILIAAGLFAVAGFFGLGFLTMASVRAMGRFTDVAVNASTRRQLPEPDGSAAIAAEGFKPIVSGTVEQASARFQGALEQLERRILELEHSSHPVATAPRNAAPPAATATSPMLGTKRSLPDEAGNGGASGATGAMGAMGAMGATGATGAAATAAPSRVEMQLGKGQALLNLDQAAQALECFEGALAEEPENTDALLRKGMALERLQEWERALECYDRAIGLDGSLTVAYLYKGGVCNRLERHREALESYEQALHSERRRGAS